MSDSIPAGSGSGQDTTAQSEVDVLNEGTSDTGSDDTVVSDETTEDEGKPEAETPSETGDEDEIKDEPELEEKIEDEEVETEDLDKSEEPTRPSWQVIKEKYPELAKDKDFRELYFREKAFTDVFPTIAEAKDASLKAEQLDTIDTVLVDGDVETLFTNINQDVLLKISDKLLPALYKTNKTAFGKAAKPLIVDVMHTVMEQAKRSGDENLQKSIRNVSRALTGSPDLPERASSNLDPVVAEERDRLQKERANLFNTQNQNFLIAADKVVVRKLEQMVEDGLDPKKEFTDFTRRAIIEKTLADVKQRLVTDEGLRSKVRHLHKIAARSGFPDEYRTRIISASLERARKLIPVLRNKHRTAAIGNQSPDSKIVKKIVSKNETVATGGKVSSKSIDTRKTSAEDFLNDKVVYKK